MVAPVAGVPPRNGPRRHIPGWGISSSGITFSRRCLTGGLKLIENLTCLADKKSWAERLLEKGHASFGYALRQDVCFGVTGHENRSRLWPGLEKAAAQLGPAHFGHDSVGHQKIDDSRILAAKLQ